MDADKDTERSEPFAGFVRVGEKKKEEPEENPSKKDKPDVDNKPE